MSFSRDRIDLSEWRSAVAAGGASLSTTRTLVLWPRGTLYAALLPTTFSTAVVTRIGTLPFLTILRTNDDLATSAVDESQRAQDGDAASHVTLSSLPTLANGGYLLVGAGRPFRGVAVDMDAQVNATASVLTAQYWNGSAWVSLSASDGTTSGGATFAQDGDVTWTVPTAWVRAALVSIPGLSGKALSRVSPPVSQAELFWTRWSVSAALDGSALVDAMVGLAGSTAFAELAQNQSLELIARPGIGGTAGVEAITDAGTAKLLVNVAAGARGFDV